jgi:hypothetical protein
MRRVQVASATALAAAAGAAVADAGGNAVDAAIGASIASMCTEIGIIAPAGSGFVTIWPRSGDHRPARSHSFDRDAAMTGNRSVNDRRPDTHSPRILRDAGTAGRPKQGRSVNSTVFRSLTVTGDPHSGYGGRSSPVSTTTRSRSLASVTSRTLTSGRPTSSPHLAIGSDEARTPGSGWFRTPPDSSGPCCSSRTPAAITPRSNAKRHHMPTRTVGRERRGWGEPVQASSP